MFLNFLFAGMEQFGQNIEIYDENTSQDTMDTEKKERLSAVQEKTQPKGHRNSGVGKAFNSTLGV